MAPFILAVIVLIVLVIVAFFAWYYIHNAKMEERKLLLEKGYDPSDLPKHSSFTFPWLKVGCVVTSGSLGLLLGAIIDNIHSDFAGLMMFLFGGIGLIIAHYVDKPKD